MSRPQFDPSAYAAQLEDKKSRLAGLLAPFAAPAPEVFESPREHYRLRAEFRLWRETGNEKRHYAMFEQGDKHTPILIEDFPIASRRINELMPRLKAAWADPALGFKLFQVEFLTTLAGDALITLCYHRPIDDAWRQAAEKLAAELGVNLVGRSRGKRIVVGRDYVEEELSVAGRRFRYRQPEGLSPSPTARSTRRCSAGPTRRSASATTTCSNCTAATATSPCPWPPGYARCWPPRSASPRSMRRWPTWPTTRWTTSAWCACRPKS